MRRTRLALVGLAAVALVIAVSAQEQPEAQVEVREEPEQVVLYSLHKGPYGTMGEAIQPLFATAFGQGLAPQMQLSLVYLNNPALVAEAHYLTEIRLPVGEAALAKEGTLPGPLDIKKVAATQVVAITKPAGEIDRGAYIARLEAWAHEHGYVRTGSWIERPHGQTADAEAEILFPVRKIAE